jgi:hypothetical protein
MSGVSAAKKSQRLPDQAMVLTLITTHARQLRATNSYFLNKQEYSLFFVWLACALSCLSTGQQTKRDAKVHDHAFAQPTRAITERDEPGKTWGSGVDSIF